SSLSTVPPLVLVADQPSGLAPVVGGLIRGLEGDVVLARLGADRVFRSPHLVSDQASGRVSLGELLELLHVGRRPLLAVVGGGLSHGGAPFGRDGRLDCRWG